METSPSNTTSASTSDDIAAFARKLEKWAQTLPADEQSLAQLLVQRAREIQPEQVRAQSLRIALSEATRTAFKAIESKIHPGAEAWVEIGPIWQKANKVEWGEEVEIIQRVDLRGNISSRR